MTFATSRDVNGPARRPFPNSISLVNKAQAHSQDARRRGVRPAWQCESFKLVERSVLLGYRRRPPGLSPCDLKQANKSIQWTSRLGRRRPAAGVGLAPGVRVGTPSESWSWKARPGAAFLRRDGRQDPVVLLPVALWVRLLCRWLAALTAVGAHHVRNGFHWAAVRCPRTRGGVSSALRWARGGPLVRARRSSADRRV